MITKKENSSGTVRVTFELPGNVAQDSAAVLGGFNGWDPEAGAMTYVKSRDVWKKGVTLESGTRHEFRYRLDGGREWRNDEEADAYAANEYFGENGVVEV